MKSKSLSQIIISFALIVFGANAQSQTVPALVNYQGRLANPDGTALATGDYQLTFRVFDTATNSTGLVWGPQVFDGVGGQGHGGMIPVIQGYFNVMLGPMDTLGASLANAFNTSNRFVEITVSNHSAILPRQQILTTPFAFNSAKLSGADWSAVFGTNDPVNGRIPIAKLATNGIILAQQIGVGTASPGYEVDVNGQVRASRLRAQTTVGDPTFLSTTGTSGQQASFGWVSSGFSVIQSGIWGIDPRALCLQGGGGNVGIGTTSPGYKLDVSGDIRTTSVGRLGGLELGESLTGGQFSAIDFHLGGTSQDYNARLINSGNNILLAATPTAGALTFLVDGKVGIGTTTPNARLEIDGSFLSSPYLVLSNTVSSWGTAPTFNAFRFITTGSAALDGSFKPFNVAPGGVSIGYANTPSYGSSDAMYVNGNVGIGTTSPQDKLDVAGNARVGYLTITPQGGSEGGELALLGTGGTDYQIDVFDTRLRFKAGGSEAVAITPGGRMGIGTASPSTALQVVGTVTATAFNPPSDRGLKENFSPVSPRDVLDKVTAMPVSRWNFIGDAATPHLGPMAQDFHAAFGLGTDERHIATVDADGVALAAIQGLNQKLEEKLKEKDAEIDLLKERLNRLEGKSPASAERE